MAELRQGGCRRQHDIDHHGGRSPKAEQIHRLAMWRAIDGIPTSPKICLPGHPQAMGQLPLAAAHHRAGSVCRQLLQRGKEKIHEAVLHQIGEQVSGRGDAPLRIIGRA